MRKVERSPRHLDTWDVYMDNEKIYVIETSHAPQSHYIFVYENVNGQEGKFLESIHFYEFENPEYATVMRASLGIKDNFIGWLEEMLDKENEEIVDADEIAWMEPEDDQEGYWYNKLTGKILNNEQLENLPGK